MPGWLIGLFVSLFRPLGNVLMKKTSQELDEHPEITEHPVSRSIQLGFIIILLTIGGVLLFAVVAQNLLTNLTESSRVSLEEDEDLSEVDHSFQSSEVQRFACPVCGSKINDSEIKINERGEHYYFCSGCQKVHFTSTEDKEQSEEPYSIADDFTESNINNSEDVNEKVSEDNADSEIFREVEVMPEPIGGIKAIQQQIIYPEIARRAGVEGKVYVLAYVNESGDVTETKIIRGLGAGLDEAAMDAVKITKFTPGIQKGKPVKVQVAIPIVFKLQ